MGRGRLTNTMSKRMDCIAMYRTKREKRWLFTRPA